MSMNNSREKRSFLSDSTRKAFFYYEDPVIEPHSMAERKARGAKLLARTKYRMLTKKVVLAMNSTKQKILDMDGDEDTGVYGTTIPGLGIYSQSAGWKEKMGNLGDILLMARRKAEEEKLSKKRRTSKGQQEWNEIKWKGSPLLSTSFSPEHQYCALKGYEDKILDWFDTRTTTEERSQMSPLVRVKSPTRPMFSVEMDKTNPSPENANFEHNNMKGILSYKKEQFQGQRHSIPQDTNGDKKYRNREIVSFDEDFLEEIDTKKNGPAQRLSLGKQEHMSIMFQRGMDIIDPLNKASKAEEQLSVDYLIERGDMFNNWTRIWSKEFQFKTMKRSKSNAVLNAKIAVSTINTMPIEYREAGPSGPRRYNETMSPDRKVESPERTKTPESHISDMTIVKSPETRKLSEESVSVKHVETRSSVADSMPNERSLSITGSISNAQRPTDPQTEINLKTKKNKNNKRRTKK